jgi:hypothetical protein
MVTQALAHRDSTLPAPADWQTMLGMADQLVKSGLLPSSIRTPQAAVAIILKGRELGVPAMYALSNIVVIQGKPAANAELMLALVYRDHGDDAIRFTETTAERCTIAYRRRTWKQSETFSFTMQDAKTAGLLTNQTWQKYPQAMLRARCISAVARMAFADSIGGMYTPEELGASVAINEHGETELMTPPGTVEATEVRELPAAAAPAPVTSATAAAPVTSAGWEAVQRARAEMAAPASDDAAAKAAPTRNPALAGLWERAETAVAALREKGVRGYDLPTDDADQTELETFLADARGAYANAAAKAKQGAK